MATFHCTIHGITPFLQHRWTEEAEVETKTRKMHTQRRDPRVEAEKHCYRRADGTIYFPGAAISRLMREAGGAHKQKSSRKSMKFLLPAAVLVTQDDISMIDPLNGKPMTDFEVDSRPVVIPSTKGRIMRHRPRFNRWGMEFDIEIDDEMVDTPFIHQLISEGGKGIGLGDYRPERGGPYGRFIIVRWAELEVEEDKPKPAPAPRPRLRRAA